MFQCILIIPEVLEAERYLFFFLHQETFEICQYLPVVSQWLHFGFASVSRRRAGLLWKKAMILGNPTALDPGRSVWQGNRDVQRAGMSFDKADKRYSCSSGP